MLDLSDWFRLADRENFLRASLRFEVSREDFVARPESRELWFYHPTQEMIGKLRRIGVASQPAPRQSPGLGYDPDRSI